jgi:antitoxin ParD1/3/4
LLREAQAKEEDAGLEALLLEGLDSGEGIPLTPEFWRDVKAETAQIAEQYQARKQQA